MPEDLRARFATWVIARLGARARSIAFDDDTTLDWSHRVERFELVDLVARVHDPQLTAKAIPLASRTDLPSGYASMIYALAATADPKVRASYVAEVGSPKRGTTLAQGARYVALIHALGDVPEVIDDLERDPELAKRIGSYDLKQMFRNTCDPRIRDRLVALDKTTNMLAARASIDACIERQKRLDPVFRAWLRPKKPRS